MPKKLLFNFNREVIQDCAYIKYSGTIITATNTLEKPIKSAILKGSTKYRNIDTGEVLDTFDEGRNLELVSVKMPVLTTTGKNLFDGEVRAGNYKNGLFVSSAGETANVNPIKVKENTNYIAKVHNYNYHAYRFSYYDEKLNFISSESTVNGFLTTPNGCHYLNFHFGMNGFQSNAEISVAEGTIALGVHESFKTNILTVNEEVELGSVGEVKDELNLLTGQLTQRTETRAYQEGDESNSEVLTDMTNTRYKLPKEVIKTVDLSVLDQDGNKVSSISSYNDTTHITTSSETISPIFEGYIATKEGE